MDSRVQCQSSSVGICGRLIAPRIVFGTSIFLSAIASSFIITLIPIPDVQKSRAPDTRGIKFMQLSLIFVGPCYGSCFISPFGLLEFWGGCWIFVLFHPALLRQILSYLFQCSLSVIMCSAVGIVQ